MLLSIVIPTHKRAAILRDCLAHIERQTARSAIEVIVVSDGHDDATTAMFGRDAAWKIPVRFFEVPKSQQGVARNRGVEEARGEYVLYIGDDIFLAADACEKHLAAHTAHPQHAVLGFVTWDPAVGITPVMQWLEKTGWQFGYPALAPYAHRSIPREMQHRYTYTSHVSLPTSIARQHRFLATDLYGWEDIEWGMRLAHMGVHLRYEPDAKAWHHHRITLEDSLRRMETLGQSAAIIGARDPAFDRFPKGWKKIAYILISLLPTMRGRHAKAFLKGLTRQK